MTQFTTERRVTAGLLILGTVLFFAGLFALFVGADFMSFLAATLRQQLVLVSEHVAAWQWGWVLVLAGLVSTVLGLTLLASMLREAGDRTFSHLGLTAFLFGAILFAVTIAANFTVTVWAATGTSETVAIALYEPVEKWGQTLLSIYTVLAFLGMAAIGAAMVQTGLVGRWAGWATIGWSLGFLVLFMFTWSTIPVLHHIMPFVIGIVLVASRRDVALAREEREGMSALAGTALDSQEVGS